MGFNKGRTKTGGRKKGVKNGEYKTTSEILYNALIGSIKFGNYYVYYHVNKHTLEVFYIGKGKGGRAWDNDRNELWVKYVESNEYDIQIVAANLTEEEAFSIEGCLIKKRNPSCNMRHNAICYSYSLNL